MGWHKGWVGADGESVVVVATQSAGNTKQHDDPICIMNE